MNPIYRIAMIVPGLPLGIGGVPTMTRFLSRTAEESGKYKVDIVSLAMSAQDDNSIRVFSPNSWRSGIQITSGELAGLSYQHIGAMFSEFEFQRYRPRRALTKLLNQYDLIQVIAGTPAWALPTLYVDRPKCLFTATTIEAERASLGSKLSGWRKPWMKVMTQIGINFEQKVLSNIDYVFGESNYTLELLRDRIEPSKLLLGMPGVDTNQFSPATAYNHDGYILAVGRFSDPRKNVRLLFKAYQLLRQAQADCPPLVLAGSHGPVAHDWDYAIALDLADHIKVFKAVSNEQLQTLYREAGLFVLSSDEEGMGIVILEAMASGIPVISTDCGGPATAIVAGMTGLLTPVGDAKAMAMAMRDLVCNSALRQQMGEHGRQIAVERFSLAAAGNVYLERYAQLLA